MDLSTPVTPPLDERERALLALLRSPPQPPAAPDWDAIVGLAVAHGVGPLLGRALAECGCAPGEVRERLAAERRAVALANLRKHGELRRIVPALAAEGIDLIPLKGLQLAEAVYGDMSLRPMSDMDLLVRRGDVGRALAVLRRQGYGHDVELSDAAGAMLDSKCNVGLEHESLDVWLELHWALEEPPGHSPEAIDAVWRTAGHGRIADTQVRLMAAELLLLHVCVHLARNHAFAFSLRGLCDIAEITRRCAIDWDRVVELAARHGWTRPAAAALWLAREHIGASVPAAALRGLGAGALDRAMLAEAMEHLIGAIELPSSLRTAPNLLAAASDGVLGAARILWRRTFLPRAELALLYGVEPRSRRLVLFYAVRLGHLLRRYARDAWNLRLGDRALREAAARHRRLAAWIG